MCDSHLGSAAAVVAAVVCPGLSLGLWQVQLVLRCTTRQLSQTKTLTRAKTDHRVGMKSIALVCKMRQSSYPNEVFDQRHAFLSVDDQEIIPPLPGALVLGGPAV
jgi:hypothetical protein